MYLPMHHASEQHWIDRITFAPVLKRFRPLRVYANMMLILGMHTKQQNGILNQVARPAS